MRDLNHIAYVRADDFYKRGRLKAATKWFLVALRHYSFDYQALWALGDTYSDLNKPQKALVFYKLAIKHAPAEQLQDLHYNLGNSFFDIKHYKKAILNYKMVSPTHKTYSMALKNIKLSNEFLALQN